MKQLAAKMKETLAEQEKEKAAGMRSYEQVGWVLELEHVAPVCVLLPNMELPPPPSQIVSYLGRDKMIKFLELKTPEERIQFMYRHEAYLPLLQVAAGSRSKSRSRSHILYTQKTNLQPQTIRIESGHRKKGEKDVVFSKQMRDAGNTAFSGGDDALALKCYNEVTGPTRVSALPPGVTSCLLV